MGSERKRSNTPLSMSSRSWIPAPTHAVIVVMAMMPGMRVGRYWAVLPDTAPPNMSPNITVNRMGIAVTSTSCSGLRSILMKARQASVVIWVTASRRGTDASTERAAGRVPAVGWVSAVFIRGSFR